jgi:hypothetical protein
MLRCASQALPSALSGFWRLAAAPLKRAGPHATGACLNPAELLQRRLVLDEKHGTVLGDELSFLEFR